MSWSLVAIIDDIAGASGTVCGTIGGPHYGIAIRLTGSGNFYGTFYDGATQHDTSSVSLAGAGRHIVGVVGNGTDLKLYLDGTLVDTTAAAALPQFVDYPFYVGVGSGLDVVIDEVVWWNSELTAGDMADLAASLDSTFPSVVAGIGAQVLYWRLGDDPGPTMADESGNGNTGFNLGAILGVTGLLTGDADTAVEFDGGSHYVVTDGDPFSMGEPPPPPPELAAAELRARTVLMDGTHVDEVLEWVEVESVERTLNQPDRWTLKFPKWEYTADQLPVLGTASDAIEVQIWDCRVGEEIDIEFDQLLSWGPILDAQTSATDGAMHATGVSVDWYLLRRFIDGQRDNLLDNGSFEDSGGSTTGWTAGGGPTVTVTTDGYVEGTHSVRLVNGTAGADRHLHQLFSVAGGDIGRLITILGHYKLESFTSPAYGDRGLFVVVTEGATVVAQAGVPISGTPTVDIWQRAECTIQVPPNKTWTLDVRLYAPEGSTLWDENLAVAMESVSTGGVEETIVHLTRVVILHLQDSGVGKSDVNIVTDPDATGGPTQAKTWQYADHTAWDGQLLEWTDRADAIDYGMGYYTAIGLREFIAYPGGRGVDRSGNCELIYGPAGNLADYRWQRDGSATVTQSTYLGDGDGPDREEGQYTDASFIGGLTLEAVTQAPPGAALNSLVPLARGQVEMLNNPPRIIDVDIRPDATFVGGDFDGVPLLKGLDPGDRVPLTIEDGYVQESGSMWRIVKLALNGQTRVLTATLNRDLT